MIEHLNLLLDISSLAIIASIVCHVIMNLVNEIK